VPSSFFRTSQKVKEYKLTLKNSGKAAFANDSNNVEVFEMRKQLLPLPYPYINLLRLLCYCWLIPLRFLLVLLSLTLYLRDSSLSSEIRGSRDIPLPPRCRSALLGRKSPFLQLWHRSSPIEHDECEAYLPSYSECILCTDLY
jgi:hypothetical protein